MKNDLNQFLSGFLIGASLSASLFYLLADSKNKKSVFEKMKKILQAIADEEETINNPIPDMDLATLARSILKFWR